MGAFSGFKGIKSHSAMNRDELNNAVDDKKALPDMVLKRIYFSAQESMNLAESALMAGYYKNGNVWNPNDIMKFRTSILVVFRLISGMINSVKVYNWVNSETPFILRKNRVNNDFELCLRLTRYAQLDVFALIHLSGYLNFCLHELGLTDLLIDNQIAEIDIKDLV